MSQPRTTSAWIACFAVLFSLLVMPLSPPSPAAQSEQLLWGSFCTGSGSKLMAISMVAVNHGTQPDDHSAMQHCACCTGSALVTVSSGFSQGFFAHLQPVRFAPGLMLIRMSPRQQWPGANPRASPQV